MSLRILLVEEDPARAETLQNAVRDRMLSNEIDYETSTNVHAAAELLRTHYYDLLILDILLPVRDGGHPIGDGGVRLLRALKTHTDSRLPGYIIGLTARENLAALYGAQRNSTGSGSEVPTQLVFFSTPPVREHFERSGRAAKFLHPWLPILGRSHLVHQLCRANPWSNK